MGGFMDTVFGKDAKGGFKEIPLTDEQKKAQDFLLNLVTQNVNLPTRQIAGLTDLEKQGQTQLGQFASKDQSQLLSDAMSQLSGILNTSTDVRETPGFQAFSEESERLRGLTQSDIARRGQARTGALSFPTAREGAQADTAINRNILAELGRRQEIERQVKLQAIPQAINLDNAQNTLPLQQLAAIQQFGALPRNIQQAQEDSVFNQRLNTTMLPFLNQAPIAQGLLNRDAFTYQIDPATRGLIDYAQEIGSVAGMFSGIPGAGSLGGSGAGGFSGGINSFLSGGGASNAGPTSMFDLNAGMPGGGGGGVLSYSNQFNNVPNPMLNNMFA